MNHDTVMIDSNSKIVIYTPTYHRSSGLQYRLSMLIKTLKENNYCVRLIVDEHENLLRVLYSYTAKTVLQFRCSWLIIGKKIAKKIIKTLRPTALYAHARVRIRLANHILGSKYDVEVEFKPSKNLKAPVRCEVCLCDEEGKLFNKDMTGSPKDYVWVTGGEDVVKVVAGKVGDVIIKEIELSLIHI